MTKADYDYIKEHFEYIKSKVKDKNYRSWNDIRKPEQFENGVDKCIK